MAATTKAKAAALAESQKPTPIDPFAWPTVLGVLPNAVQFFYKLLGGDMNQVKEVLQIRELKHIVSPKKLHEIEKQAAKQAEEFFEKNHAYPKTFGALWRKERQIKLSILQYLKEHFDEQDGKK